MSRPLSSRMQRSELHTDQQYRGRSRGNKPCDLMTLSLRAACREGERVALQDPKVSTQYPHMLLIVSRFATRVAIVGFGIMLSATKCAPSI